MNWLERLDVLTSEINNYVWGIPLISLIVAIGVIFTIRLRGIQIRGLGKALRYTFHDEEDGVGEVSSFAALCTALAATIGTGNIIGIATAICAGGPGALFWMIVAAVFGMATKYAEGLLAVKYRTVDRDGHALGGPFYYIERGMGAKWKWLGKLFSLFAILAALLGIGTFTQVNGITSAVKNFFDPCFNAADPMAGACIFGVRYSWAVVISGLLVTAAAALVLIGGIKRIAAVSEFLVPFMAITYILINLLVIFCNLPAVPGAVATILKGAFTPGAVTGGVIGSLFIPLQKGISRGVFTNESGLGSAPIAAAAAKTKEPARQGLVCMTGTFIDTVVLCTMTGLSIVLTGAWNTGTGLEGAAVTTYAFQKGLPFPPELSSFLLMVSLIFFAFSAILGWNYYAERCLEYLSGGSRHAASLYRWVYIGAILIGPYISLEAIWNIADITNGLMAFPNLIALFALSGVVVTETKAYYARQARLPH